MKRLLCAAAAIALIVPAAASAQQRHDRTDNRPAAQHERTTRTRTTTRTNGHRQTRITRTTTARADHRAPTRQVTRTTSTTRNVYRIGHRPTSFHRVRASAFSYPRGYRYRQWSIGSILPRLFLSSSYYWSNYGELGLGAPPPGYVWVRYGPDLLLVNRYTGRIADVIRGAFY